MFDSRARAEDGLQGNLYNHVRLKVSLLLKESSSATCQETESSLKRMQLRMQEAEKRMIQDDIFTDDMLLVASGEFSRHQGL